MMKTALFRLAAAFGMGLLSAAAAEKVPPGPPIPAPTGGLQVSLATGGYQFFVGDPPAPTGSSTKPVKRTPKTATALTPPESFPASALLANHSYSAITFTFPNADAATNRFAFRILDSNGQAKWQSDSDPAPTDIAVTGTLGKGGRWKRLIQVPLKIAGKWLDPGIYTLEAKLNADPSLLATALFEVSALVTPTDNGINGQVVVASGATTTPTKAYVSISEIRDPNATYDHPPFFWSGTTDDNGQFKVATPVGSFTVFATLGNPLAMQPGVSGVAIVSNPIAFPGTSAKVDVVSGQYTNVTLTITKPGPPPPNTGINGQVMIGPITPVSQQGVPNEQPLAGAIVTIEQGGPPPVVGLLIKGPWFHWQGVADQDGKFSAPTPAGKFHVTARKDGSNIGAPGSADVIVTAGQTTSVTLHVDSGIR